MKEAIVSAGPKIHIVDSPIPTPEPDQVVIKAVVSGSNPKDWKNPLPTMGKSFNTGDDVAGVVHSVGSNLVEFKRGDRVAAFHEILAPGVSSWWQLCRVCRQLGSYNFSYSKEDNF